MNLRTLRASVIGLVVLGILVFVPAGTLAYWQGWVFIIVFALSTNAIGVYLARNDPALLERRMNVGPQAETRPVQKVLASERRSRRIIDGKGGHGNGVE